MGSMLNRELTQLTLGVWFVLRSLARPGKPLLLRRLPRPALVSKSRRNSPEDIVATGRTRRQAPGYGSRTRNRRV